MKLMRKNGGFTLVELIVVIAILAILAGIAVPAYSGYIQKAEKAADMQLLGAVNSAFQAACLAEDINPKGLTGATMPIGANKTINVAGIAPAEIQEAFAMFFRGNENTAFKVLTVLAYDPVNGVFGEPDSVLNNVFNSIISNEAYAGSIQAVKDSAFATNIGAAALLGQVVDVSSMAADMIAANSTLTGVVLSEEYLKTLAGTMGLTVDELTTKLGDMEKNDPEGMVNLLANSTVLNVANTMNSMTTEEEAAMKQNLANLSFGQLGTTLNEDPETGLSQAALLYGMYTAFDPDGAKNLVDTKDVTALMNLGGKTNASGQTFADYIAQVNTEGSQAAKDYAGYKSSLDIVNGAANESPEAANKILNDGYGSSDLQAMLQQVMGK